MKRSRQPDSGQWRDGPDLTITVDGDELAISDAHHKVLLHRLHLAKFRKALNRAIGWQAGRYSLIEDGPFDVCSCGCTREQHWHRRRCRYGRCKGCKTCPRFQLQEVRF